MYFNESNSPKTEDSMNAAEILNDLDRGAVLADLSEEIDKGVAAVQRTRDQKATIVLTLEIAPVAVNEDGKVVQFGFNGNVKGKLPRPKRNSALYYQGQDGTMQKRDPRQPELPVVGQSEEASDGEETAATA